MRVKQALADKSKEVWHEHRRSRRDLTASVPDAQLFLADWTKLACSGADSVAV